LSYPLCTRPPGRGHLHRHFRALARYRGRVTVRCGQGL